ncbi:hypothetical protein EXN66_Car017599 [Channa argus]|uniref:Uncharacterized protein n=1 Tax=Channa argus TaxID=215402 RepID=A0A6G1QGW3_CHAAH|nr:hypothetical protein EXN66_Car017599 [Channa argus]
MLEGCSDGCPSGTLSSHRIRWSHGRATMPWKSPGCANLFPFENYSWETAVQDIFCSLSHVCAVILFVSSAVSTFDLMAFALIQ